MTDNTAKTVLDIKPADLVQPLTLAAMVKSRGHIARSLMTGAAITEKLKEQLLIAPHVPIGTYADFFSGVTLTPSPALAPFQFIIMNDRQQMIMMGDLEKGTYSTFDPPVSLRPQMDEPIFTDYKPKGRKA